MIDPETGIDQYPLWVAANGDHTLMVDHPIDATSVVVDIGCYKGRWSRMMAERYGCTIHAYEPVVEFAAIAERELADYPKAVVYRYGLGATDAQVGIDVRGDASSLYAGGGLSVPIRAVQPVVQALGHIDLLAVNIEGGEYELLPALQPVMHNIDRLLIQFHNFSFLQRPVERRLEARAILGKTHRCSWCFPFVWECWVRSSCLRYEASEQA